MAAGQRRQGGEEHGYSSTLVGERVLLDANIYRRASIAPVEILHRSQTLSGEAYEETAQITDLLNPSCVNRAMSDRSSSRRQFLLGGAAGALFLASGGCGHHAVAGGAKATTLPELPAPPRDLPQYSQLLRPVGPPLSAAVAEAERSPLLVTQGARVMEELRSPPLRPSLDRPLLVSLTDGSGPLTLGMPTGERCMPIFTSPLGAADYKRLLLADMPSLQYRVSSATQLVRMLRAIESVVPKLTVDRCPRCTDMVVMPLDTLRTPDDIINLWSIFMASKKARFDLYLGFANKARDEGNLELARDTALAAVAHVAPDDVRPHQLLLEVATQLGDETLRREAETYLAFLRHVRIS